MCFRRESSARDGKGVEAFGTQFVIPYEWLVSRLLRVLEGWNIAGLFFFGRIYVALRVQSAVRLIFGAHSSMVSRFQPNHSDPLDPWSMASG